VIENGRTFKENAIKKAVKIARFTGKLTLGEDPDSAWMLWVVSRYLFLAFSGKNKSDLQNNLKYWVYSQALAAIRERRIMCALWP